MAVLCMAYCHSSIADTICARNKPCQQPVFQHQHRGNRTHYQRLFSCRRWLFLRRWCGNKSTCFSRKSILWPITYQQESRSNWNYRGNLVCCGFDFADKKNHYLSKLRKVRSGRVYRSNRYRETGTTRQNNRQSEHKDKCRIMLQ